jgi:arginase
MTSERDFTIIEAPSILGLKPSGVERLPEALLEAGLAEALNVQRHGRVEPEHAFDARRNDPTQVLNTKGLAAYMPRLADAVQSVLDRGELPIVLGGDCSILLGSMLALRRRGRFGLLFIDGQADFYQPEAEPNGEAASMDLALATGRGPDMLTNLEGREPLVRDEDVVLFGYRDAEEQRDFGSQPVPMSMLAFDLDRIRADGVEAAARAAVEHLGRTSGPEAGFWVHVDADVLDDELMPAVDYRMPGGLSWNELSTVLSFAFGTSKVVGFEVTIYNPSLDPDGACVKGLVETLVRSIRPERKDAA